MSTQPVEKESIGIQTFLHRDLQRLNFVIDQLTSISDDQVTAKTTIKVIKEIVDQIQAEIEELPTDELMRPIVDFVEMKVNDLIALMANQNYKEADELVDVIQGNLYMIYDVIDLVLREVEILPDKDQEKQVEHNNENQEEAKNSLDDLTPVDDDEDYETEMNEDYYADD